MALLLLFLHHILLLLLLGVHADNLLEAGNLGLGTVPLALLAVERLVQVGLYLVHQVALVLGLARRGLEDEMIEPVGEAGQREFQVAPIEADIGFGAEALFLLEIGIADLE